MKSEYLVLLPSDICCSLQCFAAIALKPKSYDGKFVTAKCSNINYGATLKYLKQQNLLPVPLLPAIQEIQGNMDGLLSRNDLRDDEKAKLRYFQLQNRYLAFKEQLNTRTRPEEIISTFQT